MVFQDVPCNKMIKILTTHLFKTKVIMLHYSEDIIYLIKLGIKGF